MKILKDEGESGRMHGGRGAKGPRAWRKRGKEEILDFSFSFLFFSFLFTNNKEENDNIAPNLKVILKWPFL